MLQGLHFLLTYQCLNECDHCFLYCGPHMSGTFTLDQVERAIQQGVAVGITSVYVEGGEPFLYYPLMLETLRLAKRQGLRRGIVTNCYWAVAERDAELWLEPLIDIGLDDLSVSDDSFHSDDPERSPAKIALAVAVRLGLPADRITIEAPRILAGNGRRKGEPVVVGDVVFRGRAVEKLSRDLPRRVFACFTECTEEDLINPTRVHLDPFGNVFVCQGISIGNIWQQPLAQIMREYRPEEHPILGPLVKGGPAELARVFGLPEGDTYISGCHLCYLVRKKLLDRFPRYLCPRQVYGVPEE
jgi:hypothetical protein